MGYRTRLILTCMFLGTVLSSCGDTQEAGPATPLPEIEEPSLGIATVDLERIYLDFHKTKLAQAKADKRLRAAREVGRPMFLEIEWMRTKILDPQTDPAEAANLKLQADALRVKLDELTRTESPEGIPDEEKQAILGELSQRIGEFVESKGFSVVLDKGASGNFGSITYPLGNIPDLTEHVIQHLQSVP